MRAVKVELSLVNFLTILDCKISKKVNEHGHAVIIGYIQGEDEENLIQRSTDIQFANIKLKDESGNIHVLFSGLVTSVRVEQVNGLKKAEVKLMGGTRLMESIPHIKTFQNKLMTYEQLLMKVDSETGASHILKVDDKVIGDLIVQYKETDWDFVKRLAAHFHTIIIPYYKAGGIKYFFGLGSGEIHPEPDVIQYSIQNEIDQFYCLQRNGVEDIHLQDVISYHLKTREVLDLGDGVQFQKHLLYVYSVESCYIGAEMIHIYQLRREGGFSVPMQYNYHIIGASLDATILAAANDTVKVCVKADGTQEESTAKWFPYSTVYSSPDGSGWYCMPEKGDQVRLYFPGEREQDGYIISAVHVDKAGDSGKSATGSPPRSDPNKKSISNKEGKLIELTPTSILITNNKGMSIVLDDNEGISINSNKDVVIQSEENISIKSLNESMNLEAMESIELIQGSTKITVKDDVIVKGAKFKVQ